MKHFALFFKYDTCKLSKKNPKGISHIYIYMLPPPGESTFKGFIPYIYICVEICKHEQI